MSQLLTGLLGLLATGAPARAVDYATIDRTLRKEPAYQSRAPKYALLLFGREARVRVWAVLDGETLYLDRNADSDLTGDGKRFAKAADCKDVEVADPDGKTKYLITGVHVHKEGAPPRPHLMVNVDVKGPVAYRQYCDVEMRDGAKGAAIAHFHGPLTVAVRMINWKVPPGLKLVVGDKPGELNATVGTLSAEHGCWVVVRSHHGEGSAFPKSVCPVVDVEFPPRKPGGPPVKKRYLLDKFC